MADSNSKALAKNTVVLYVRMFFSMLVSLYTSRVILKYLGVEDYGIYNAVGGIVSMFGIISTSLSTSISRNITFELGRHNIEKLKKVFSMSINIQIVLILIILLIGETIGLWFVNTQMVIPIERINAANWIYQISMATFAINLISIPYNASIIAHERMTAFAYIGVLETLLKLVVVYMLAVSPIDRLISYGLLLLCISLVIRLIYQIYCKRNFEECEYQFILDKSIFNEMFGFAAWNFIGTTSSILRSQGLNVLLNLFFGPAVNAARAISTQVNGAINSFVSNFMTALTPQITKAYAKGDLGYVVNCIYRGAKFSFYLLLFLSLPVMIETDYILKIWLVNVPNTTVWFVRFILLYSLADTYSRTLINASNATGDIKRFQLVTGGINLMVLPVSYIILKLGSPAESTVLVSVFTTILGIYPRVYYVRKHIPITVLKYIKKVILPTITVALLSFMVPYLLHIYIEETIYRLLAVCMLSCLTSIFFILFLGCTKEERYIIFTIIKNKIQKNEKTIS